MDSQPRGLIFSGRPCKVVTGSREEERFLIAEAQNTRPVNIGSRALKHRAVPENLLFKRLPLELCFCLSVVCTCVCV